MALTPGTRLGVYEVTLLIGEGGMGQVYQARDTKLSRDVALKVLPEAFVLDPDRLARFKREAQLLASLNHPNIAAIYGFEECDGVQALVLELVDGPTLADRIGRGAVPIADALAIARQIAEALEAAHERGIIHRDLKPANIKVRNDGVVKVLDFGLAKALDQLPSSSSDSQSPTLVNPATTGIGVVVGTAAYMSPEQAKGQDVDRTTDVWSFGCVLYEMLTGRPVFTGGSVSELLSEVLKSEPDWARLPKGTPANVHRLLHRCLRKDRRVRLRDMGDARLELDDVDTPTPDFPARAVHKHRWTPAAAGAAIVAIALASWLFIADRGLRQELAAARPVARLELSMPAGVELMTVASPSAVISPDGTRLAFTGTLAGTRRLYVRRLDQNEATVLAGTETANQCFFSADGGSLAFITSDRTLKTISIADGLVAVVASGVDRNNGSAWGADGRLTVGRNGVLWQFSADGSSPTQLTTLDVSRQEFLQMWPTAIDQGRTVLFTSVTGTIGRPMMRIEAVSTATRQRRTIVDSASYPLVVPSGHLVFFRDGALVAASFDEKRLAITSTPVRVLTDVALDSLGAPLAAVSPSGALVYVSSKTSASRLVWVSREGVESAAFDTSRMYEYPRIAPTGPQIAVAASGAVWVLDAQRATAGLLSAASSLGSSYGTWMTDGQRLVFRTATGLSVADADGTRAPEPIADTSAADFPNAVSPDGSTLILTRQTTETSGDVYALSLSGPSSPQALVNTRAYEGGGQLSPDGKWLLYTSDESGKFEVYVQPYPGLARRWPASTDGGTHARWSPDGREIFYRQGSRMLSVSMSVQPHVSFSQSKLLFDQQYAFGPAITFANYDVARDGQRFLMIRNDARSGRLNVVLNWTEELKRLVPAR